MIDAENLTKRYGKTTALDGLDLHVREGTITGFLGPNGAGKTTFIKIAMNLLRPTEGSISVLGLNPQHEWSKIRKRTGYMPEVPGIYPSLTPREHLEYFAGLKGVSDDFDRILGLVGLGEKKKSRAYTLSHGMRQRLGLAIAILGEPDLLVLDEPANGMDPVGIMEIRKILEELNRNGTTIFLSSHLLHEVEILCSDIALLYKGKVMRSGRMQDILSKRFVVRLKKVKEEYAEGLKDLAENVDVRESSIELKTEPDMYPKIISVLVGMGAEIMEAKESAYSLEDFFLKAVT